MRYHFLVVINKANVNIKPILNKYRYEYFHKILITVWLLLGFISCHSREGNKKTSMQKFRSKVPISYLPGELDTLYQPLSRDSSYYKNCTMNLGIQQRGYSQWSNERHIRHGLEFTWREKADSLITVWYIREADTLKCLRYFSTQKSTFSKY